jgi:hypothetical protein
MSTASRQKENPMNTKNLLSGLALFALPMALGLAMPSLAMPNNGGSGTTMDDLKKGGYSCERVSVNFIECTKPGSSTYWCTDNGECQQARKHVTLPGQLPGAADPGRSTLGIEAQPLRFPSNIGVGNSAQF